MSTNITTIRGSGGSTNAIVVTSATPQPVMYAPPRPQVIFTGQMQGQCSFCRTPLMFPAHLTQVRCFNCHQTTTFQSAFTPQPAPPPPPAQTVFQNPGSFTQTQAPPAPQLQQPQQQSFLQNPGSYTQNQMNSINSPYQQLGTYAQNQQMNVPASYNQPGSYQQSGSYTQNQTPLMSSSQSYTQPPPSSFQPPAFTNNNAMGASQDFGGSSHSYTQHEMTPAPMYESTPNTEYKPIPY